MKAVGQRDDEYFNILIVIDVVRDLQDCVDYGHDQGQESNGADGLGWTALLATFFGDENQRCLFDPIAKK